MYDGKLKDTTKSYYNFILKKYNISRADFEHSLDYYSENTEEYLLIYDEVIARINEMKPIKLHENSDYRLFEDALKEAKILSNLEKHYGKTGKELWTGRRAAELPRDTASLKFKIEKDSKYQSLLAFMFEVKLDKKDTSRNLRAELEIDYKDSTKFIDTVFIKTNKKKKWETYKLIAWTDSLKEPVKVKARLFEQENKENTPMLNVRRLSLRQYAPDKDTSKLFWQGAKKDNKKRKNDKKNLKKFSSKNGKKNPKMKPVPDLKKPTAK